MAIWLASVFLMNAGLSAWNTDLYAANGNPGNAGAAVFCGLVAVYCALASVTQ